MNSGVCLTEKELDKIVERKMEMVIKKYDREIAALEEKIRAQDVKILYLEKKYSAKKLELEKKQRKKRNHSSALPQIAIMTPTYREKYRQLLTMTAS